MDKTELTRLVDEGYSIQDLASKFNKSKTSVRHWLKKYSLKTVGKSGRKTGHTVIVDGKKKCASCGELKKLQDFYVRKDRNSYTSYCKPCNSKITTEATIKRNNKAKEAFIKLKGGKCNRCGKSFPRQVFDFHHTEPEHKDFNFGEVILSQTIPEILEELEKCDLLCTNCHQLTHYEMKQEAGYDNKIKGNTELWNANKKRKLDYKGKHACEACGYDEYVGSLALIFKDGFKHYRKYNKTHWDADFTSALDNATILCNNCLRSR